MNKEQKNKSKDELIAEMERNYSQLVKQYDKLSAEKKTTDDVGSSIVIGAFVGTFISFFIFYPYFEFGDAKSELVFALLTGFVFVAVSSIIYFISSFK